MLKIHTHCKLITRRISSSRNPLLSSAVNNSHKYLVLDTNHAACQQRVEKVRSALVTDLLLYDDFVNQQEHDSLMKEIDRSFRRTKYQYDHWDGAICGFRETEKSRWQPENEVIVQRIRDVAFVGETFSPLTHVLDLAKDGSISPHIDSVKFCGSLISGLNLMSSAVMRFVHNEDKGIVIDLLLPVLSLYVMKDSLRFDFTHEVLGEEFSYWNKRHVPRERRVSILMRNEPR